MKTIFFNYPIGTPKVCFTVSKLSIKELEKAGVIPKGVATVSYPFIDENSDIEMRALTAFPDRCEFDNLNKPTKVQLDMDLMNSYILSEAKAARAEYLNMLDKLQIRALVKNKTEVINSIEADKQALRDLPDNADFSAATGYRSAYDSIPLDAFTDFEEKYKDALK